MRRPKGGGVGLGPDLSSCFGLGSGVGRLGLRPRLRLRRKLRVNRRLRPSQKLGLRRQIMLRLKVRGQDRSYIK